MQRIYWQGSMDDIKCPQCDSKHLNTIRYDVVEEDTVFYDYFQILCETCSNIFEVLNE